MVPPFNLRTGIIWRDDILRMLPVGVLPKLRQRNASRLNLS